MMSQDKVITILLVILLITTAIGMVYTKHKNRKLFIELQSLQLERDDMNTEWGKLQLEQATWGAHGRIEQFARKKLRMDLPGSGEVIMVMTKKGEKK